MSEHTLYTFETTNADGVVDTDNAVIYGASMITGGLTAKGHDLEVDGTTLKQIFLCAKAKGKVPVKTNHGSGVDAVNGYLTNFRIDGDKVRGDWHLLANYKDTAKMLEMAERMPDSFGLSVAFHGEPEKLSNGKKAARCTELVSTDLVASPAANPGGMFSSRVDSAANDMATTPTSAAAAAPAAEPTLADLMKAVQGLGQRIESLEQGGGDDDELSDEEIDALIEQGALVEDEDGNLVLAEDADGGAEDEGGEGGEGEGVAESEAETAEAALSRGDLPTYFEARINQLETQLAAEKQAKKVKAEANAFAALEAKITALASHAEQMRLENEALNELVTEFQAGGGRKTVSGGQESTMFDVKPAGQATTFEAKVSEKFQQFASRTDLSEAGRKAESVKAAIAENPGLYAQHLKEKGVRK